MANTEREQETKLTFLNLCYVSKCSHPSAPLLKNMFGKCYRVVFADFVTQRNQTTSLHVRCQLLQISQNALMLITASQL